MAESANAATPCTSAGVGSPVPEYVRFELVDFNAKALSKLVPMRHKESKVFMYSGALAMGANATVLTFPDEVNENGCCNSELLPDWSTLIELPWAGTETPPRKIYRVCCEQRTPAGELVNPATPRAACRRLVEELKQQHGLELFAASELEFSVMEKDEAGELQPIFQGVDIFATLQQSKCAELQYEIAENMIQVGVDVCTMNAEYGAGQLEITMAPARGIQSADNAATFRTGVKEICQQKGLLATFFSYPMGAKGVGNGGHFNFSLWDGETSVMQDVASPSGMSETAKHWLAGILAHVPALEAFCAPTESCYSR
jgi:glutamine synthetase